MTGALHRGEDPWWKSGPVLVMGAVVILAVAGVVYSGVLTGGGGDPTEAALAALDEALGAEQRAGVGETREVPLPDGSSVRLGADASVRTHGGWATGSRAMAVTGPVAFSLRPSEEGFAAIRAGGVRLVTAGATGAVSLGGDGTVFVSVDSGEVVAWRDSSRVRMESGTVTRLRANEPSAPATDAERRAAFAWRDGRFALAGAPLGRVTEAARRWFGVELRFPTAGAADTVSVDVPLASRDSLVAAIGAALKLRPETAGTTVTFRAAPAPAPQRQAAAPAAAPLLPPPTIPVITIPPVV